MTEIIKAEIIGSDRCEAEGFSVRANAPVLALCRKLIEAGFDPARPLEAYRGSTMCLRVRSIGEGAKLSVEEGNRLAPGSSNGGAVLSWASRPGLRKRGQGAARPTIRGLERTHGLPVASQPPHTPLPRYSTHHA